MYDHERIMNSIQMYQLFVILCPDIYSLFRQSAHDILELALASDHILYAKVHYHIYKYIVLRQTLQDRDSQTRPNDSWVYIATTAVGECVCVGGCETRTTKH